MSDSNQLVPLDQFGPVADVFKGTQVDASRFTSGIGMAWPILTLKGKSWGWRFRGESRTYTAPNAQAGGAIMPVQFIDVVLVDAGSRISKVYYKEGYKDGQRTPPDCWSADGITPDPAASEKQANTCGGCRHNVFGSKLGDQGQKGKACTDNKRLAVVTTSDLANVDFGGPFMLRVPPGSFANYTTYVSVMAARGYHPFQVVTRMMFDPAVAHPKIQFLPVRPLSNDEAAIVVAHIKNPRTGEMLNDKAVAAFIDPDAEVSSVAPETLPTAGGTTNGSGAEWKTPAANDPGPLPEHLKRADVTPPTAPSTKPVPSSQAAQTVQSIIQTLPPALTPAQQQIVDLKAKLAEAEAAAAAPPPEVPLTPEQMEIQALKARLAEAEAAKKTRGRPRAKPVGPPDATTTQVAPQTVTQPSNGAADVPSAVGNAISDRIAGLVGKNQ